MRRLVKKLNREAPGPVRVFYEAGPWVRAANISGTRQGRHRRLGGAEGQNRTADTVIFSHVLYQLSYLGTAGRNARGQDRRS